MKRCEYIRALARRQEGFGLIEFLTAMVVLAIAVAALLTVFTAATRSLGRAGERGTATTLAERQLELYRKLAWEEIRIDASQLSVAADVPAPYLTQTDPWFPSNPSSQVADEISGTGSDATDSCLSPVSFPDPCEPVQNVIGPDKHPYRVDTYIQFDKTESTPSTPITTIKRVWVVVYRVNGDDSLGSRLARASSSYASFNYTGQ